MLKRKRGKPIPEAFLLPPDTNRVYKAITLSNGLSVLVVSDEEATQSAASMTVRVGSLQDPKDIQGLAHFLEHAVFLTTKNRESSVRDLDDYLSKHGGTSNAHTHQEYTIFSMNVDSEFLRPALRKFSKLFVNEPLLEIEPVKAEITSIEAEFVEFKRNDQSRLDQLRAHTMIKNHPLNHFSLGNRQSLSISIEDICDNALKLFNECYIGASMNLVIIGNESVRKLAKWASVIFDGVQTGTNNICDVTLSRNIWSFDKMYLLEAVHDMHSLEISWMIPPKTPYKLFLEKPEIYLIQVLGHKCRGSLYSFFKEKGWIADSFTVSCGDSNNCTSFGRLFYLSIALTKLGLKMKFELVTYLYQYLKLVKDNLVCSHVLKDYRSVKLMEFESLDNDQDTWSFSQRLAENMLYYPLKHVVSIDYLYQTCTEKNIQNLLKHLCPQNMRIDLLSKSFIVKDFKMEPWFNSRYVEETIPSSYIKEWFEPSYVNGYFRLPPKNTYLPYNYQLREIRQYKEVKNIVNNTFIKLWHKREDKFPEVNLCLFMNVDDCAKQHLMAILFVKLFNDHFDEFIFQFTEARLTFSLEIVEDSKVIFILKASRERLIEDISYFSKQFIIFLPTEERFKVIKEILLEELSNSIVDLDGHSTELLKHLVIEGFSSVDDRLEFLKRIKFDELESFIKIFRSKMFIEGICGGDILKKEAMRVSNCLETGKASALPESLRKKQIHREVPHYPLLQVNVNVKNKSEACSVAKVYFQIGTTKNDPKNTALVHLFKSMIEENLITHLRTEKELGYNVGCACEFFGGINGFVINVLSPFFDPNILLTHINEFIENCEGLLVVDKTTFKSYKQSVDNQFMDTEDVILEWLSENRYPYGFCTKVTRALRKLKVEDVREFYKMFFLPSSLLSRKVQICIWGCKTPFQENLSPSSIASSSKQVQSCDSTEDSEDDSQMVDHTSN